jgi:hypothetical protein
VSSTCQFPVPWWCSWCGVAHESSCEHLSHVTHQDVRLVVLYKPGREYLWKSTNATDQAFQSQELVYQHAFLLFIFHEPASCSFSHKTSAGYIHPAMIPCLMQVESTLYNQFHLFDTLAVYCGLNHWLGAIFLTCHIDHKLHEGRCQVLVHMYIPMGLSEWKQMAGAQNEMLKKQVTKD